MRKQSFYLSITFLLMALALLLAPVLVMQAGAMEIVTANQMTVGWDAVTSNDDGTTIGPDQVVEYQVWVQKFQAAGATPTLVGTTDELQYTITFPDEGVWQIGFSAKKYQITTDPDGGPDVKSYSGESVIAWSVDATVCLDGQTFAGVYLKIPGKGGGLNTQ